MKNFFKKIKNKNEMLNEGLANDNRVYNEIGNVGNVVNSGTLGDFGNVNMPKFGMMGSNPIMNEISKQTDIPQMNNDMLSNSNSYKSKTEDNILLSSVNGLQPVENKIKPLEGINISAPVEQPKISEDLRNFATELVNKNNVRTIQNMMEMANNYLLANNITPSNTYTDNNFMLSKSGMSVINQKDLTAPDYFANHSVAKNSPAQQSNIPTGYASPVEDMQKETIKYPDGVIMPKLFKKKDDVVADENIPENYDDMYEKILKGSVKKDIFNFDSVQKVRSSYDPLLNRNNPLSKSAAKQLSDIQNSDSNVSFMKYYRISATGFDSIQGIDSDNEHCKLHQLGNGNLKKMIKDNFDNIDNDTDIIIPKEYAQLRKELLGTYTFKHSIKKNIADIKAGKYKDKIMHVNFPVVTLTGLVLGKCKLYDLHYDNDGNIRGYCVDKYDFSKINGPIVVDKINNNAYEQQEKGYIKNYILVVPFKFSGKK